MTDSSCPIAPDDPALRPIYDGLKAGLGQPLGSLRDRLNRLRADHAQALSREQMTYLDTMSELCNELHTLIADHLQPTVAAEPE